MASGTALIMVNNTCKGHKDRNGAEVDYKNMIKMFKDLGFETIERLNLTACDIRTEFHKACNIPSDMFVFAISTHGEESHLATKDANGTAVYDQLVVGYDGQTVSVNELLKLLDNDALKGKPKLCFLQACRSITMMDDQRKVDTGVTVEVVGGNQKHGNTTKDKADGKEDYDDEAGEDEADPGKGDSGEMPKLPAIEIAPVDCPRDCLIMYAVQPHKLALRNPTKGSWMFHYMFESLHDLKNNDGNVLQYLTTVLKKMADHASDYKGQKVKLCGTIYHRLTREVFLHLI